MFFDRFFREEGRGRVRERERETYMWNRNIGCLRLMFQLGIRFVPRLGIELQPFMHRKCSINRATQMAKYIFKWLLIFQQNKILARFLGVKCLDYLPCRTSGHKNLWAVNEKQWWFHPSPRQTHAEEKDKYQRIIKL